MVEDVEAVAEEEAGREVKEATEARGEIIIIQTVVKANGRI